MKDATFTLNLDACEMVVKNCTFNDECVSVIDLGAAFPSPPLPKGWAKSAASVKAAQDMEAERQIRIRAEVDRRGNQGRYLKLSYATPSAAGWFERWLLRDPHPAWGEWLARQWRQWRGRRGWLVLEDDWLADCLSWCIVAAAVGFSIFFLVGILS